MKNDENVLLVLSHLRLPIPEEGRRYLKTGASHPSGPVKGFLSFPSVEKTANENRNVRDKTHPSKELSFGFFGSGRESFLPFAGR